MIEELNLILKAIAKKEPNKARRREATVIGRHKNHLEWMSLSAEAKQEKRKTILKAGKRYLEEDGIATFEYENAVVDFYDVCTELLKEIEHYPKEDLCLTRLKVLMQIDMLSIDSKLNLWEIKTVPLITYQGLQEELEEANINLVGISRLIENVRILYKGKSPSGRRVSLRPFCPPLVLGLQKTPLVGL